MTKAVGLADWAGRDHVTDLDLAIDDDDTGNQPLDQLPLLLPTGLFKTLAHALAEPFHVQPKARDLGLTVRLCLELALLPSEGLLALLEVAPPPLIFRQVHHARKVSLSQPFNLSLQTDLPVSEGVAVRLQFLRQPVPAMSPLQREADRLRVGQHLAEVIPDQRIQLGRGTETRGTGRVAMRMQG
jgi:hypothetical protein